MLSLQREGKAISGQLSFLLQKAAVRDTPVERISGRGSFDSRRFSIDIASARFLKGTVTLSAQGSTQNRITSYNVCYTKLLRNSLVCRPCKIPFILTPPSWIVIRLWCPLSPFYPAYVSAEVLGVITSYSIHYTKLYDSPLGKILVSITMFAGRLGPLTIAVAVAKRSEARFRYPEGKVRNNFV